MAIRASNWSRPIPTAQSIPYTATTHNTTRSRASRPKQRRAPATSVKGYPKSSKSQREVPLPPHVAFPPAAVELPWGRPEGREKKLPLLLTTRSGIAVAVNTWNTWTWKSALARAGVIPRGLGARNPGSGQHPRRTDSMCCVMATPR